MTYTSSITVSWIRGLDGVHASPKEFQAKLNGLMPDTFYKARVIAQNALGTSSPSADFNFKTDMEGEQCASFLYYILISCDLRSVAPSEVPTHIRIEAKSAS